MSRTEILKHQISTFNSAPSVSSHRWEFSLKKDILWDKIKALWHWNAFREDRHYNRQTTPMIWEKRGHPPKNSYFKQCTIAEAENFTSDYCLTATFLFFSCKRPVLTERLLFYRWMHLQVTLKKLRFLALYYFLCVVTMSTKFMAFLGWPYQTPGVSPSSSYQIDGVRIVAPKNQCSHESAQILASPVYRQLKEKEDKI
jgi:hypothetical protein